MAALPPGLVTPKNRAWDCWQKQGLFWQIIQKQQKKTILKRGKPCAAEGSDWFWWFGEGHSSNQDAIFDRLFREHLCGIYKALNEPVPLIYTNH